MDILRRRLETVHLPKYSNTLFVNIFSILFSNRVIKVLAAELYFSKFLITPILQHGILQLVFNGDLVYKVKSFIGWSIQRDNQQL